MSPTHDIYFISLDSMYNHECTDVICILDIIIIITIIIVIILGAYILTLGIFVDWFC